MPAIALGSSANPYHDHTKKCYAACMANDDCADCAAQLVNLRERVSSLELSAAEDDVGEWMRVDRWHRTRDAALNALLRQGGTWAMGLIIADASAYADKIHGPLKP